MTAIKVGILEDDAIIAMSIQDDLQALGYIVLEPTTTYAQALKMVEEAKPDIILIDIMLGDGNDGIDFAVQIKDRGIPVIFVTAYSDNHTVSRAKNALPAAYVLKPFDRNDLYTAIEIALHNYCNQPASPHKNVAKIDSEPGDSVVQYRINDAIFVKQGQYLRKIRYADILYLESDNTYLYIHTHERRLVIRTSLASYLKYLGSDVFCRVHRSYAVNLQQVDAIHSDSVLLSGQEIPIGKLYRAEFMNSLRIS